MDNVGFQKLDVIQSSTQKLSQMSPMRKRRGKINFKSKKVKIITGVLVAFLVLFLYTGLRAYAAYGTVKKLKVQAQKTKYVLSQQDVVAGKDELVATQTLLKQLDGQVNSMFYLKFVPIVSWYYSDAQHGINAAEAGVSAGITTTESLIPYADVLGLKGGSSFTGGSAEDRIRLTVKSLGKVVPKIDDIEKDLLVAQAEIDKINPKHYPNVGKFKQIRAQIASARKGAVDACDYKIRR
jgi:cell division protein FtsB